MQEIKKPLRMRPECIMCLLKGKMELFPKLTSAFSIPFSFNKISIFESAYPFPYPPKSTCNDSDKKNIVKPREF